MKFVFLFLSLLCLSRFAQASSCVLELNLTEPEVEEALYQVASLRLSLNEDLTKANFAQDVYLKELETVKAAFLSLGFTEQEFQDRFLDVVTDLRGQKEKDQKQKLKLIQAKQKKIIEIKKNLYPLKGRTPQVVNAILMVLDVSDPKQVSWKDLNNITSLQIFESELETLSSNDLEGLDSLESIVLSLNKLRTIPSGFFRGLKKLREINLYANLIDKLPEDLFEGLLSLEELTLKQNKLTVLPPKIFNGLKSLERIDLDDNPLQSFPNGVFNGLNNLGTVLARNCKIKILPEPLLRDLRKVSFVWLSGNPMSPSEKAKIKKIITYRKSKNLLLDL